MRKILVLRPIIIALFFCLLLPITAWSQGEKGQNEKHIYTVIEFESTFMNRKKEKVLGVLGEPDRKWEHRGKKVWTYKQIIKEQEKIWDQNIMFDFGRVNMMWGDRPTAGGNEPSTGRGAD
jgi:hypothetical protein